MSISFPLEPMYYSTKIKQLPFSKKINNRLYQIPKAKRLQEKANTTTDTKLYTTTKPNTWIGY